MIKLIISKLLLGTTMAKRREFFKLIGSFKFVMCHVSYQYRPRLQYWPTYNFSPMKEIHKGEIFYCGTHETKSSSFINHLNQTLSHTLSLPLHAKSSAPNRSSGKKQLDLHDVWGNSFTLLLYIIGVEYLWFNHF